MFPVHHDVYTDASSMCFHSVAVNRQKTFTRLSSPRWVGWLSQAIRRQRRAELSLLYRQCGHFVSGNRVLFTISFLQPETELDDRKTFLCGWSELHVAQTEGTIRQETTKEKKNSGFNEFAWFHAGSSLKDFTLSMRYVRRNAKQKILQLRKNTNYTFRIAYIISSPVF